MNNSALKGVFVASSFSSFFHNVLYFLSLSSQNKMTKYNNLSDYARSKLKFYDIILFDFSVNIDDHNIRSIDSKSGLYCTWLIVVLY